VYEQFKQSWDETAEYIKVSIGRKF